MGAEYNIKDSINNEENRNSITGELEGISVCILGKYVILRGKGGSGAIWHNGRCILKARAGKDERHRWRRGLSRQIKSYAEKAWLGQVLDLEGSSRSIYHDRK